jgi:hypothetical protein
MPIRQDLLDEVDAALGSGVTTNYSTASAANDLFEGYVFSLVIAAARAEGAQVSFEDVNEAAVTSLVFRTSPGFIYSRVQPYTHARIAFPRCPELEAHIGVFVGGRSGVLHECDVAVIDRREAQICRAEGVHPRSGKLLVTLECKFHAGTLQLGQARSFLGLTAELTKNNRFLVTNNSSETAEKMVTYHKAEWEFRLDLINPDIASNLRSRLARAFRNFKATRRI